MIILSSLKVDFLAGKYCVHDVTHHFDSIINQTPLKSSVTNIKISYFFLAKSKEASWLVTF